MLKTDMEFGPFYLFVRQFVCNFKIPLRNLVITPSKVLAFQLLTFEYFGGGQRQSH